MKNFSLTCKSTSFQPVTYLPTRRGSGSERWSLAAPCSPLDPRKGCERKGSASCHRPRPRNLCCSGSGTLRASAHSARTDKGPTRRASVHRTYLRRGRDITNTVHSYLVKLKVQVHVQHTLLKKYTYITFISILIC